MDGPLLVLSSSVLKRDRRKLPSSRASRCSFSRCSLDFLLGGSVSVVWLLDMLLNNIVDEDACDLLRTFDVCCSARRVLERLLIVQTEDLGTEKCELKAQTTTTT